MMNSLFGEKTTKFNVAFAIGAAIIAVYEAITTVQQYKEDNEKEIEQ